MTRATITGTVEQIKTKQTRVGDMFDVVINGRPYGNGKYPPRGVKPGDTVTFEYEVKENGQYTNYNIVAKTMRVDGSAGTSASSSPAPSASPASAVRTSVVTPDRRQEVISKQSAMNTALTMIGLQLTHGAIKLPAKPADAFTVFNTLVAGTASRVYEVNTGEVWGLTPDDLVNGKERATPEGDMNDDDIPF